MRLTVHRGTQQIGGSCIELEAPSGDRLILDIGRPLEAPREAKDLLPSTLDISRPASVVISHPHADHWGLLNELPDDWTVWTGEGSAKLITLTANLFGDITQLRTFNTWNSRTVAFDIGPFRVTPSLTDHSGFDAYMLSIECDGKRVLYSGDFRTHGRKSALVERFIRSYPPGPNVLIMEGTNLQSDKPVIAEEELTAEFVELARQTSRHVFVDWSAQNIDRIVTLFRAARVTGRQLVVDLYSADVLDTIGPGTGIPHFSAEGFAELKVVITRGLAAKYRGQGRDAFVTQHAESARGLSAHAVASGPPSFIMGRKGLLFDYERKGLRFTSEDAFVHSNWAGYLSQPGGSLAWDKAQAAGAARTMIHTSGHASAAELSRFAKSVSPQFLVPVHGVEWDNHGLKLPTMKRLADGESWYLP